VSPSRHQTRHAGTQGNPWFRHTSDEIWKVTNERFGKLDNRAFQFQGKNNALPSSLICSA